MGRGTFYPPPNAQKELFCPQKFLITNRRAREKRGEPLSRKKLNWLDFLSGAIAIWNSLIPSDVEAIDEPCASFDRQILKEWKQEMGLERKSLIWGLHEVTLSYAPDLFGHASLALIIADMLYD